MAEPIIISYDTNCTYYQLYLIINCYQHRYKHPSNLINIRISIIQQMQVLQLLKNDIVRMMFALVIQIALSYQILSIRNSNLRFWYSLLTGTLLQFFVYGIHTFNILLFALLIYFICRVKLSGLYYRVGAIATGLSIALLSFYHLQAIIHRYGEETMDEVVLLMIFVCKCSLFAYAVQDGRFKIKQSSKNGDVDINKSGKANLDTRTNVNEKDKLKQKEREKFYITQDVKLIDYIGYIQFLPTAVMGPPIQYKIYDQYINRKGSFQSKLPTRKWALLKTLKQFGICAIFYVLGLIYFPIGYMKTQQFYSHSTFYIFCYTLICLTLVRFKYYSAWKIGIGSIHSSGVSYNTKTNDFTAIEHCNPLIVETTPNVRDRIANWNMMVQQWLRKCIYERVTFKSRFLRQLSVFMVSAFWHGFYLGYYLSFFLWFAQVFIQSQIYKLKKQKQIQMDQQKQTKNQTSKNNKSIIKTILNSSLFYTVVSLIIFNHNASYFVLLEWSQCFRMMKRMYFIPQILIIAGILKFTVFKDKNKKRKYKKSDSDSTVVSDTTDDNKNTKTDVNANKKGNHIQTSKSS